MDLERVLASSCRRRIIRALWKHKWLNVMDLVRKTNSTYSQVDPQLKILAAEGIIVDEHLGRMRVIKLNRENPKTMCLLEILKIYESPDISNL